MRARQVLLLAALAILAYGAVNFAVNPLVLDEVLVPGQIINGQVVYPSGHPHEVFYKQAFCVWNYLGAGMLALIPDAELSGSVHSVLRNLAFLFLALFTPFALTLVLTRSTRWAMLAAALVVSEDIISYHGVYPVRVFPEIYSHGQYGQLLAVLAAAACVAGWWRTAGFLAGAFPAIHGGIVPPLWLWVGLFVFLSPLAPRGAERRRFWLAFGAGLGACVALAAAIALATRGQSYLPIYAPDGDGEEVTSAFLAITDSHRKLPILSRFGYAFHVIAFAVLCSFVWVRPRERGPESDSDSQRLRWIALLGAIAWLYVIACYALQAQGWIPHALLITMPGRISNLSALILAPLTAVLLARMAQELAPGARLGLYALLALLALAAGLWVAQDPRFVRSHLWMCAWGILLGGWVWVARHRLRLLALALSSWAVLEMALYFIQRWPPRPASLALGFALALVALPGGEWLERRRGRFAPERQAAFERIAWSAIALGCILLAAFVLPGRDRDRLGRPRVEVLTRFDGDLRQWLKYNARPNEIILTPIWDRAELQQKTLHPVLLEPETLWLMSYMPSLSNVIGRMVRDLSGVDYAELQDSGVQESTESLSLRAVDSTWTAAWEKRTAEEWLALGRRYDFRLVLSRANTPLDLPIAVPGTDWNLHVIP